MSKDKPDSSQLLRVCYFGTYRANYTRNQILIAGLNTRENVELMECHATLWHGIDDRVEQASGGWRKPRFWGRVLTTYWQLFRAHNKTGAYDVMLVGYPGQFDSYLGRLLSWRRGKPMALDILMSLHLVAEERGLTRKSPFTGRLIFFLEKGGLKLPNMLISENSSYENYYIRKYHLSPEKFQRVPHGADDRIFHPRPIQPDPDSFRVTYHGTYLPSHGLDAIIGAALRLSDRDDIHFHFFGSGPEKARVQQIAAVNSLKNVTFHGFVSQDELLDNLARSQICLGVFGETKQSHYTIQNKVWEGLAMGRAVISGDSQVVRESLLDRQQIYLVERNNPQALADAIITLQLDPELREGMAQAGYERFRQGNAIHPIGEDTEKALRVLL